MWPFLSAGDFVITCRSRKAIVGDVIVVNDDRVGRIVKRVSLVGRDEVSLEGDNPRLASSSCDYPHKRSSIIGRVIFRFRIPFIKMQ
jgi:phage repressor protein C with HTH and peptisase S24 domain